MCTCKIGVTKTSIAYKLTMLTGFFGNTIFLKFRIFLINSSEIYVWWPEVSTQRTLKLGNYCNPCTEDRYSQLARKSTFKIPQASYKNALSELPFELAEQEWFLWWATFMDFLESLLFSQNNPKTLVRVF